jgi:hypothetical protein
VDNQQKKKQPNKWLALINIPIQMGAIIYLSSLLGNKLDQKFPNKHNIYVKGITLTGIALAFYNLNRQLKDINSTDE